jgi:hypothetical protein
LASIEADQWPDADGATPIRAIELVTPQRSSKYGGTSSTGGVCIHAEFPDLSSSWNVVYFLNVGAATDL